jgi:nicotinate-nucleotide adenylyltransferase
MSEQKIALFGGTFDPIHLGHTHVAAEAAEYIVAEKVIFVPAKRSPLKEVYPRASGGDRMAMIALAIEGKRNFELSDYELNKSAPSYTLDTVRRFKTDYGGNTSIHWLIGADSIEDLPYWHRIADLIDECSISTMYRAGCAPPDFGQFESLWGPERIAKLQRNIVPTSLIDISSTEVRNRIATGLDVADMLHPAVAEYIREHGLYRKKTKP